MKEESQHHQNHSLHLWSFKHRSMPPKGFVAVRVGLEGEEREKFVVPVEHFKHPLFVAMLEEAEKEFGFKHTGPIVIPCCVDYFKQVEGTIDREGQSQRQHHHHGGPHLHLHVPHFVGCFRA